MKKNILSALATGVLFGVCASSAFASGTIRSEKHRDYCIALAGGSTAEGTKIVLQRCNESSAQNFQWYDGGGQNAGDIRHVKSNKCIDIQGGSSTFNTPAILWKCHGGENQRFLWAAGGRTAKDGGTIRVMGKCLAIVAGGENPAGSVVGIADCDDKSDENWIVNMDD